jgi:hypothetical protein
MYPFGSFFSFLISFPLPLPCSFPSASSANAAGSALCRIPSRLFRCTCLICFLFHGDINSARSCLTFASPGLLRLEQRCFQIGLGVCILSGDWVA